MIISASRRTDIPRYYADWFINCIRAGFCDVPNPYNPVQVSHIDLRPETVTAIVFWTRFPKPLVPYLDYLDELNYKYYFQFTLNNYPKKFEHHRPSFADAVHCFKELASRIGPGRMIWRYDPIFFTDELDMSFHLSHFHHIAEALAGQTKAVVISFLDEYRKTMRNFVKQKINYCGNPLKYPHLEEFISRISAAAALCGMDMQSCAEENIFSHLRILPGRCIDDRVLNREFNLKLIYKKDPSQRKTCGCMVSKDIGSNNTCLAGCMYCYATSSHKSAGVFSKNQDNSDTCTTEPKRVYELT